MVCVFILWSLLEKHFSIEGRGRAWPVWLSIE